jgi:integrase
MSSEPRDPVLTCPPFTPHDLRRSAATGMARLGIDRLVIAKVLNHRSADHATVTGLIYDRHDYAKEKRAALARWAEHVAGLEVATEVRSDEPAKAT